MKPLLFTACDEGYWDKYAKAFKASAEANGMECQIACSGKRVGPDYSQADAMAFKYQMLPDVLRAHERVLMLDIDSIIRKPIEIDEWWDAGFVIRDDLKPGADREKKIVNGGCIYLTPK